MKKLLKMALALLPLAVMTSCAADDPLIDDSDGIAKKTEKRYLQVTLVNATGGAPGTRAAGELPNTGVTNEDGSKAEHYYTGTPEENRIKTMEFYFYDRYKQFHSYVSIPIDKAFGDIDENGKDPDDLPVSEPNVAGILHCNVPIELVQGETLPSYVICILNSVEGSAYEGHEMSAAQSKVLHSLYSSSSTATNNYFGMSNSVYYGRDESTGEEDVLIMATPFTAEKLKTATEINKMTEEQKKENTVEIYVERYASKVTVDMTATEINPVPTTATGNNAQINLTFTPTRWAVNCTEKEFFFLKAFRTAASSVPMTPNDNTNAEPAYGNQYEDFATLNSYLFTGWNNATDHRSFWARTPAYYDDLYPLVSDDVDNKGGKNDDGTINTGDYRLNYFSYNQCKVIPEAMLNTNGSLNTKIFDYAMETTMKETRLTGEGMGEQYMPLASIPSVLICGQYKINGVPTDFYIYGEKGEGANRKKCIYSGEDPMQQIDGTIKLLDQMINDQTIIVCKDEKGDYIPFNKSHALYSDLRDKFTIEHPSEAVRNENIATESSNAIVSGLRVAEDIQVLQITASSDNLYFYNSRAEVDGKTGAYQAITDANITLVNRLLLQNLGGAHFYNKGMAFFTAPIFHWGWYRSDNVNRYAKTTNDAGQTIDDKSKARPMDEWEWNNMKAGDFGLVRNHAYEMSIGTISGLGTAIADPEDPIVPPAEKVGYEVHFHVNIQKWAVLPVQTWDF